MVTAYLCEYCFKATGMENVGRVDDNHRVKCAVCGESDNIMMVVDQWELNIIMEKR